MGGGGMRGGGGMVGGDAAMLLQLTDRPDGICSQ